MPSISVSRTSRDDVGLGAVDDELQALLDELVVDLRRARPRARAGPRGGRARRGRRAAAARPSRSGRSPRSSPCLYSAGWRFMPSMPHEAMVAPIVPPMTMMSAGMLMKAASCVPSWSRPPASPTNGDDDSDGGGGLHGPDRHRHGRRRVFSRPMDGGGGRRQLDERVAPAAAGCAAVAAWATTSSTASRRRRARAGGERDHGVGMRLDRAAMRSGLRWKGSWSWPRRCRAIMGWLRGACGRQGGAAPRAARPHRGSVASG